VCVPVFMCVHVCLCVSVRTTAVFNCSPRHRVTGRGQNVTLTCDPESGHNVLYWYRQSQGQGLQLMMYFQGKNPAEESGLPGAHFSAERPGGSSSTLKIQPSSKGNVSGRFSAHQFSDFSSEMNVSALELQDSAVYLCASSLAQPRGVPSALCTNLLSQCGAASADIAVRQATEKYTSLLFLNSSVCLINILVFLTSGKILLT
uniref:Ig-like domain-containing protein n=1 Tax=Oryctolagus cuniculus TaxID=9986 RepID=A0A5F9C7Z6_RABIT